MGAYAGGSGKSELGASSSLLSSLWNPSVSHCGTLQLPFFYHSTHQESNLLINSAFCQRLVGKKAGSASDLTFFFKMSVGTTTPRECQWHFGDFFGLLKRLLPTNPIKNLPLGFVEDWDVSSFSVGLGEGRQHKGNPFFQKAGNDCVGLH